MLERGHYNSNGALGEDFLKIEVNEEKHSLQKIIAVCDIKNISKFDIEHPLLDISELSKLSLATLGLEVTLVIFTYNFPLKSLTAMLSSLICEKKNIKTDC